MRNKRNKIVLLSLSLLLAIGLVVVGCAAPAPVGSEELEAALAAEKARVTGLQGDIADLEKEITGLKEPVEPIKWTFYNLMTTGPIWDNGFIWADRVKEMTDGGLEIEILPTGALAPTVEELSAVGTGVLDGGIAWPSYFIEQFPEFCVGDIAMTLRSLGEMYAYFYTLGGLDIINAAAAEHNVIVAGNVAITTLVFTSKVPIYKLEDVEGVMFRASEEHSYVLGKYGAGLTWVPGGEIYTLLATGAVDAVQYAGALDAYQYGFAEVTSYWTTNHLHPACHFPVIINLDAWNALPPAYQAIIQETLFAYSDTTYADSLIGEQETLKLVEAEHGITLITWPEDSINKYTEASMEWAEAQRGASPRTAQLLDIILSIQTMMGYR